MKLEKVEKAVEITDAKIQFVSLVDKAANKRRFLLRKARDGQAVFSTYGRIIKADRENHYVTGIVYEPMEEDCHGNYMTAEEIRKAAYWFAKNGDKVDIQHSFEPLDNSAVVETWIAKSDFEIGGEAVKEGTWLITVEVGDPQIWESVEKGEITGFSMGGIGSYGKEDIELSQEVKKEKGGLLKQIAAALGFKVIEKGEVAEIYREKENTENIGNSFWNAFNSLEEILHKFDNESGHWVYEKDETVIKEALEDFNKIVTEILTNKESNISETIQSGGPIEKAGRSISGRNKEALQNIYDNLGTFLASFEEKEKEEIIEENEEDEKEMTKKEVESVITKSVSEALRKALEPEEEKTLEKPEKEEEITVNKDELKKMIDEAVASALKEKETEKSGLKEEEVQKMVMSAVQKAMEPILKSKGLPNNLNGREIEKSVEAHYLQGIL